jgi:hypothetical protein
LVLNSEVVFMETVDAIRARLESAQDLTGILRASWDAFELARAITSVYAERDHTRLAMFLYAGSAACVGRDAIYTAPSALQDLTDLPHIDDVGGLREDEACDLLAVLALTVSQRLSASAADATDQHDRDACAEGAAAAGELRDILTGAG